MERSPGEERVLAKGNSVERDFDKAGAPVREKASVRGRPDEKGGPRRGPGEKNTSVKKGFGGERLSVRKGPSSRGGGLAKRRLGREWLQGERSPGEEGASGKKVLARRGPGEEEGLVRERALVRKGPGREGPFICLSQKSSILLFYCGPVESRPSSPPERMLAMFSLSPHGRQPRRLGRSPGRWK